MNSEIEALQKEVETLKAQMLDVKTITEVQIKTIKKLTEMISELPNIIERYEQYFIQIEKTFKNITKTPTRIKKPKKDFHW